MSARTSSEDKPPAVTTPRNTLSENLGVVVISLGAGVDFGAATVVLTGAIMLGKWVEQGDIR